MRSRSELDRIEAELKKKLIEALDFVIKDEVKNDV